MIEVEALIEAWEEAAHQFGQELEEFLNHLPAERARFWNIELWLWLENQRAHGFRITNESYERLRKMLDRCRDELIAQGAELQQAHTPSPEQTAREQAAIRARNELGTPNSLIAATGAFPVASTRMAPDESGQSDPGASDDEVRYWVEKLRGLIQSIMQNYPAERWVEIVADALKRIGVPREIADKILEWVQAESDRYLFFKRIVDDALRKSAEAGRANAERSPAEELADIALEMAKGLEELSADGKPERLFKALQRLIDRFPEFVPESLRSADLDELTADLRQTMQLLLKFLESLPPEAYGVIPDLLQGMLDIIGLFPVIGEVADVISGVLSYYRGEILAVALTVVSLIPVLGAITGVAKILTRLMKILKVVKKIGKRAVREALEKLLKFLIDELGGITFSFEWLKKFLERLRILLRELIEKIKKGGDGPSGPKSPSGKDPPKKPSPGGRRIWTKAEYDQWFANLKTKPAPKDRRGIYQRRYAGDTERQIRGGGSEFYTDGIEGSKILDTKLIGNPKRSPYIAGSDCPPFVRAKAVADVDGELRRMAEIIRSDSTPLESVEIITNDFRAKSFFEGMLSKYKQQGLKGTVVIKPE